MTTSKAWQGARHESFQAARAHRAVLFAACSSSSKKAATPADTKGAPQAFAFQIGGREAFALEDGDLVVPNDGKVIATGHVDEAGALLAKAGLPGDTISSRCW